MCGVWRASGKCLARAGGCSTICDFFHISFLPLSPLNPPHPKKRFFLIQCQAHLPISSHPPTKICSGQQPSISSSPLVLKTLASSFAHTIPPTHQNLLRTSTENTSSPFCLSARAKLTLCNFATSPKGVKNI